MSRATFENGFVLCHHGRPMKCGECAAEYVAELDGPAGEHRASDDTTPVMSHTETETRSVESTGILYRELELAADTFRDFSNVLRVIGHDTMAAAAAIAERHIREQLANVNAERPV